MRQGRKKMTIREFEPLTIIGRGAFGEVRVCRQKSTGDIVAIKKMRKEDMLKKNQLMHVRTEREIMTSSNEWIVNLKYSFQDEFYLYLVMDYLPGGDLMNLLMKKEILTEDEARFYTAEMILAVESVHKLNCIHRDLKPDNILMTEDEQIKICDFGSSKNIERKKDKRKDCKSTPYVVTRYYRAPELFFGKINYDSKIDIFSCGCIIAELFTLSPLFPGLNEGLQIFEYINILGMPDENYLREFNLNKNILETIKALENIEPYTLQEILNPNNYYDKKDIDEVCDLLYNMLKWNYNERFTAEQCLKHSFFKNWVACLTFFSTSCNTSFKASIFM